MSNKVKLTLSIDRETVEKVKEKTKRLGTSLSKIVENFLKFYSNPAVYCFTCGEKFEVSDVEICPKCGWFKCPYCGACGCDLSDEARVVAFQMRKVYEDLLLRNLKMGVK